MRQILHLAGAGVGWLDSVTFISSHTQLQRLTIMIPGLLASLSLIVAASAVYEWAAVDNAVQKAINEGIFHGCVLGVATSTTTLLRKAYGTIGPKRGMYSPPVTAEMQFDLGYLTEPVGINAVLMEQWDKDMILTTNKVSYLYSAFGGTDKDKKYVTVQNLLEHNSGLPATYSDPLPVTPEDLIKNINSVLKLSYKTESKTLFSQLGPIVLGQVIEKITKKTLPAAFFQIMTIMGMRDTAYCPVADREKIAPSGFTGRVAWGTPYNRLAHFLKDTAGNAGLFSTVADVVKYMQLMLNRGKMPEYFRVFSETVVDKFLNVTKYRSYNNTRALGWETVPLGNCPCGHKFSPSPNSFGFSDLPSGSFVWADKLKNVSIVLLANGAFPSGRTMDPTAYQAELSDAVMEALGH